MSPRTLRSAPVKPLPLEVADDDLVARFARGDARAFDLLVARHQGRVVGLAARLLGWSEGADDVAQEVFLALWRHPRRFAGRSSVWTYLAAITVNRCRSVRRRRLVHDRVMRWIRPQVGDRRSPAADAPALRDETAQQVRAAVARLPQTDREVIVLRYLEELSLDEVAGVLHQRRNTVEVRLSRARRKLETLLGHLAEEP